MGLRNWLLYAEEMVEGGWAGSLETQETWGWARPAETQGNIIPQFLIKCRGQLQLTHSERSDYTHSDGWCSWLTYLVRHSIGLGLRGDDRLSLSSYTDTGIAAGLGSVSAVGSGVRSV